MYNFGAEIGRGEKEVEENREIASKDRIIMKDLMQDIEYLASPVADNLEYLSAISGGAMSKNLSALTLDQDIFTEVQVKVLQLAVRCYEQSKVVVSDS